MAITCKGKNCGLRRDYILKHFVKSPDCRKSYTNDEILAFRIESKNRTAEKRRERRKVFYDSNKRALKYQREKKQISERYSSEKRAKKYILDKKCRKISKGRKKYDPQKRAERYQIQKDEIKKLYNPQKRRKRHRLSKSRKAKAFSVVVTIAYKKAWGKLYDIYYKRFKRQVNKELNVPGFVKSNRDRGETFENMMDTKMDLSFKKLPYYEGLETVQKQAFKFFYREKFQIVYYRAFDAAMDSVFKSSIVSDMMWEKKQARNNPQAKIDEKFQSFIDAKVKKFSKELINQELFQLSFQLLKKLLANVDN